MRFEIRAPASMRLSAWPFVAIGASTAVLVGLAGGKLGLASIMVFLIVSAMGVVNVVRAPRRPGRKSRDVAADAAGLHLDGKLVVPRADIERAYCMPHPPAEGGAFAVHVVGRRLRRGCTVWVPSRAEGDALVAALETEQKTARAQFRALPPWAKHLRWLVVILTASPWVLVNLLRLLPGWGLGLIAMLYGVILLPTLMPQRVEVGHDGVFMKWLGNSRFIPFSRIDIVTSDKVGIQLFLHDERHVEIRLTQRDGAADGDIHALVSRIQAGIDAHRALGRADEEAFLARGARDVATWVKEMRELGAGESRGYRSVAIPRERLWAVVENPAVDPSAREGAALALSTSLDEQERTRLKTLAQSTALPRLRVALDGVGREREETRLRIALEAAESELEGEPVSERLPAARSATAREE